MLPELVTGGLTLPPTPSGHVRPGNREGSRRCGGITRIRHLHCKPIAVRDSSDQHLVWCRLHFGLVTLVTSDYRWVHASARDASPKHARQVFVRAAVSS